MLDISISELLLTSLIGFLVLGKDDFKNLLKIILDFKNWSAKTYLEWKNFIKMQLEDEEVVEIIYDDQGNPHKSYNLDKIKPYIKNNND